MLLCSSDSKSDLELEDQANSTLVIQLTLNNFPTWLLIEKKIDMNYGKNISKLLCKNSGNSALVGTALIGGVILGAALAVLFAPKKGKELREDISGAGYQFKGTLSELMEALKSKFSGSETFGEDSSDDQDTAVRSKLKPKSDIGELIREAHKTGHAPGQNS